MNFLGNLAKPLTGGKTIIEDNLNWEWKVELVGQAKVVKRSVGGFKKKIQKYELLLGIETD
jgi:hypothetical protein